MRSIGFRLTSGAALACLAAVGLTTSLRAQEVRDLTGFSAIEVGGGIDLDIEIGEHYLVEVSASNGDTSQVLTDVKGDTLKIGQERSWSRAFDWSNGYAVRVVLPALESLGASGGSDVRSQGPVTGDTLRIRGSGGSDISLEVDVVELEIETSGGSDVTLSGRADSLHARTSGGSDLSGRDFTAGTADLRSSGGSDISVTVLERLVANASGGSDITYSGDPSSVDVNASGAADVTHR